MSLSAQIRWVCNRWPDLTDAEVARLARTTTGHVKNAKWFAHLGPCDDRPAWLPPEVEHASTAEMRAFARRSGASLAAPIRTPLTTELLIAAKKAGLGTPAGLQTYVDNAVALRTALPPGVEDAAAKLGLTPAQFAADCVRQAIEQLIAAGRL